MKPKTLHYNTKQSFIIVIISGNQRLVYSDKSRDVLVIARRRPSNDHPSSDCETSVDSGYFHFAQVGTSRGRFDNNVGRVRMRQFVARKAIKCGRKHSKALCGVRHVLFSGALVVETTWFSHGNIINFALYVLHPSSIKLKLFTVD
jgi:hypothetical protein